jgi:ArsR family transcriptional regulator
MPKKPKSSSVPLDDSLDAETFAKICKALGHPTRIKILDYLKQTDKCICGKIVGMLPLAQSTVSQHLKHLKEAGLVMGEVEGLSICYCLNKEAIERFKKAVEAL